MLFTACEKESTNVLNSDQGVSQSKLSSSDELLIEKADELELFLKKNKYQKSLLPLNVDHIVCEAILNKQLCNNKKAYDVVNTSIRMENIFTDGLLTAVKLNEFMNNINNWVSSENQKINDFRGNYLIDIILDEEEIIVRLVQMYGNQIIERFGDRPNVAYTNEDHYSNAGGKTTPGFRSNANCDNLGGNIGAPDVISQRINRVRDRLFYNGYYININVEPFVNYYSIQSYCTNSADPDRYFYSFETDRDNCREVLSPEQMRFYTNGYFDYAFDELSCAYSSQEFINIDMYFDVFAVTPIISADYTFGTFIADPLLEELVGLPI